MIELPRAALTADQIASEAEFFSFGTNDLTQTTFGFSRDDAEGKFLLKYVDGLDEPGSKEKVKILKVNPFQTLDREGVGQLVRMAVEKGRKTNPTWNWASVANTAAIPKASSSATRSASTM